MQDRPPDPDQTARDIISFLAMEADAQRALIGPAEDWFIDEDPAVNAGANYLRGLYFGFVTYKNFLLDNYGLSEQSALFELRLVLDFMMEDPRHDCWSIRALVEDTDWRLVRRLARAVLSEAGLECVPPKAPFWFPDLIEMCGTIDRRKPRPSHRR